MVKEELDKLIEDGRVLAANFHDVKVVFGLIERVSIGTFELFGGKIGSATV